MENTGPRAPLRRRSKDRARTIVEWHPEKREDGRSPKSWLTYRSYNPSIDQGDSLRAPRCRAVLYFSSTARSGWVMASAPSWHPAMATARLTPVTDDAPEARLFVRGFGAHQVAVGALGLVSRHWSPARATGALARSRHRCRRHGVGDRRSWSTWAYGLRRRGWPRLFGGRGGHGYGRAAGRFRSFRLEVDHLVAFVLDPFAAAAPDWRASKGARKSECGRSRLSSLGHTTRPSRNAPLVG
jgi:hypothetical protein